MRVLDGLGMSGRPKVDFIGGKLCRKTPSGSQSKREHDPGYPFNNSQHHRSLCGWIAVGVAPALCCASDFAWANLWYDGCLLSPTLLVFNGGTLRSRTDPVTNSSHVSSILVTTYGSFNEAASWLRNMTELNVDVICREVLEDWYRRKIIYAR